MMQGMTEGAPQKLIVAVSGGVDSVVLLHQLAEKHDNLVVAHVDHGIRADSANDAALVQKLAKQYELPFVSTQLNLGSSVSEDTARIARYEWLERIRQEHQADAVATAHHQDDVLETIILNIMRGTGWRGLASLRSTPTRYRPLLNTSKAEIVGYALDHNLEWHEDSTNESLRYHRNRVRWLVMPRLSPAKRQELLRLNASQLNLRQAIDTEAQRLSESYCEDGAVSRYPLIMLDQKTASEIFRAWLGESLEHSRQDQLLLFAKTAKPGAKWSLDGQRFVVADRNRLIVQSPRD